MHHNDGQFLGGGGLHLYYQRWRPDAEAARAMIVMLHGDFAHSGWYMNLPTHEVPRGIAVYAFDRRGWGRSPGQRGAIHAWSDYLEDLDAFLHVVREAEPGCPLFLMGHTGSALIVLEYARQHPKEVQGVFCVSPILELAVLPASLRILSQVLSRLAPWLTIDVKRRVDASADSISHDPQFNQMTREDPLRNTKVTPRWLTEVSAAVQRVNAQAEHFACPLLLLIGEADRTRLPLRRVSAIFKRWRLRIKRCTRIRGRTPTSSVIPYTKRC